MTWFLLSFLTAITVATHDAWMKKWFSHLSTYEMFVYPLIYVLPLCLISLFFIAIPSLDYVFFISFIISLPLNAVPFFLYMKAIQVSPLSLTVPYLAFTPVFMIATGFVFLDEMPDRWGMFGIASVCLGSYVLNIDIKHRSLLAPFRAVFKETGSWLMLLVAFVFSFSAIIGKLAILHSSVMFFQMSFFTVLNSVVIIIFLIYGKISLKTFKQMPVKGACAGLLLYFHIMLHGFAISMTKAVYMMSVKRLSILFGVIYGGIVFKEENFLMRFLGALLMFAGAGVILLMAR